MHSCARSTRLSILVVEDDEDIREAIRDALEDEGYCVAVACDGRDALRWLRGEVEGGRAPVSLILLDLMMPTMDGAQFRAEQLADLKLRSIPVVLLSADLQLAEKAAELRTAGYVGKPVELQTLLQIVERHAR